MKDENKTTSNNLIDDEIRSVIELYHSILLAKTHSSKLKETVEVEKRKILSMEGLLTRKEETLNELESGLDIKQAWRKLIGKADEHLELEKERYYDLYIAYNTSLEFIKNAKFEIEILEQKITKQESVQEEMQKLLLQRKDQIEKSGASDIQAILNVVKKIDNRIGLKHEIAEAHIIGEELVITLKEQLNWLELKSTRFNHRSTSPKIYNLSILELEEIQKLAVHVKNKLIAYEQEVKDIYKYIQLDQVTDINMGTIFIEEFFENIKTDHTLLSGMESSMLFVRTMIKRVKRRQQQFANDINKLNEILKDLAIKRDEVTLGYNPDQAQKSS